MIAVPHDRPRRQQSSRKEGAATVSGGTFGQADGIAEGGQPLGVIAREAVRVEAIEVVK
jgi:hypothetical protein